MLQKLKRLFIPLLILAAAVAVFMYMKSTKPQQKQVEIKEKVWMVETHAANFESLAPVQTLYGQVESHSMVYAAAPVNGVVATVSVKEGQEVVKGAPLVALTKADLEIPLAQAKADLADAKAQLTLQRLTNKANQQRLEHETDVLKLKKTAVKRAQELMKKNLASQSSVDAANEALVRQEYVVVGAKLAVEQNQLKLSQSQARVAKSEAGLQQAQLNYERGQLVAPYDIRIAKVNVSEGSRVSAGNVMIEFYGLDTLELRAKLPVADSIRVQKALKHRQHMLAYYQTAHGEEELVLSRLAGQASTSGVDAFFAIPKHLSSLRTGELMEVNLKGLTQDQVLAVPYSAIYGNNRLYIVEDERLKAKEVELIGEVIRSGALWALVKADFAEGTKVNVTHLPNAATGLKVLEVAK